MMSHPSPDNRAALCQAAAASDASERFVQGTLKSLTTRIAVLDAQGVIVAMNAAWKRFAQASGGAESTASLGANYLTVCEESYRRGGDATAAEALRGLRAVVTGEQEVFTLEYPCHSDQLQRWFCLRATAFRSDGVVRVVVAHENITQNKAHEADITRLNRLHATLSQVNRAILRCSTRDLLFRDVCRVLVESGRFKAAWIGWKAAEGGPLTTVSHDGLESNLTLPGWQSGCGVMAEALRTGRASLCNDSLKDERAACCHEALARLGVRSCAAFPLSLRGEVCGVFSTCSIELNFFNPSEIRILDEVTSDLSFALERLDQMAKHQEAERRLRESEKRFRSLAVATAQIIWTTDGQGQVSGSIPSFQAFTGQSDGEVRGSGWTSALHPEDLPRTTKVWQDAIETKAGYLTEYRLRRHDGVYRYFAARGAPVLADDGRVVEWVGNCDDITERKQTEAALRENEHQFRATFEQAAVGMAHVALNGGWLRVNERVCEIVGYSREELLQKTFQDITHPTDLTTDLGFMRRVLAGELTTYTMEKRYLRKDGSLVPVNLTVSLCREISGEPKYFISVIDDISERKEAQAALVLSEERLRLAMDAAQMGTWERDLGTGELSWSASEQLLMGYEPGTFPGTYGAFFELVHPDSHEALAAAQERARSGDGAYRAELRFRLRDGRERWGLLQGRTIFDEQGKPLRLMGVQLDISERKRLEAERWALEVQLRQQQKLESLGTLASGVAHEINNPINGIMNYAQLIQDRLEPSNPLASFTSEIIRESQRVATIARNLLTFARDEKQSHSPARIEDIIEGVLSLIRTVIRHDQIRLSVQVPEGLPDLKCRSQQIQQVLMNLMTNARDALNERYPGHDPDKVLAVSAHLLRREERRWIRVTIEDHGGGITPAVRERMFDPFFTTKPRDKGTGLGLAISHGIVKEHHGELTVDTEPGGFTRLHVDLPVDDSRIG